MKIRAIHIFIFLMGLLSNVVWSINPILIVYPLILATIAQLYDIKQAEKERSKE